MSQLLTLTSETLLDHHTETQRKPTRTVSSSIAAQSFSTDSSFSALCSHDLNSNYDDEEGEELHTQVTVDRENSFEDLEQLLTQLDWAPPHGNIDDPCSDSDLICDPSTQPELDEDHISDLEMRALKEHLKAVVKNIHIAIGEQNERGWTCVLV